MRKNPVPGLPITPPSMSWERDPKERSNRMRDPKEWRCSCGKLLGKLENNRLHIRIGREHQYTTGLPASSVCQRCKKLNEVPMTHYVNQGPTHL